VPDAFPTDVPESRYDIAVLQNKFPSLQPNPPMPAVDGSELYSVKQAAGVCEVVLYSQQHDSTLAQQPLSQIYKLIKVWTDRTEALAKLPFVEYVFVFENKGEEVGVTLVHPHGQIYAYPIVPAMVQTELNNSKAHQDKTGRCLVCDIMAEEQRDGRRVVAENAHFIAYVPFFARWPYELHITAKRHLGLFTDMSDVEHKSLAAMMKGILTAFDGLFERSFPYLMGVHQAPVKGQHDYFHWHMEFYPPLRTKEKLKFRSGSETGAGFFITDILAEDKAGELKAKFKSANWNDWV
jgi:UDPglucose--hexose-1-phosphate uridylyltransferase